MKERVIGDCRLILGDCRDVLPSLGKVDAVVTDPPYGIGADKSLMGRANRRHGKALCYSKDYGASNWDNEPADPKTIARLQSMSDWQIIFGGNYFPLPPSRCWLVWDKLNGDNDYADCELAWTNLDRPVRRIQFRWHGMLRDEKGERVHPAQKPIGVMRWCLSHLPSIQSVCDPYLGSGTTAIACVQQGLSFIGCELNPQYFDIACRRIEQAYEDQSLLTEIEKPKEVQADLFAEAVA